MYTPDVSYHENKENEKYKVYITYKIAIRNESTNIYTKANEIINYYDKRYTIDSIKDENNNNILIVMTKHIIMSSKLLKSQQIKK